MRNFRTSAVVLMTLLVLGCGQAALAQSVGSPSQFCKETVEPTFTEIGVPLSHSSCVTLFNGNSGGPRDVGVCKWARDLGAIQDNEVGKCVSGNIPDLEQRIIDALQSYGVFGATEVSLAVFTALLLGWVIYQRKGRRLTV
jgi:hypothetical protein